MDDNKRLLLAANSGSGANKKLNDVLENKEEFLLKLKEFRQSFEPNESFQVLYNC